MDINYNNRQQIMTSYIIDDILKPSVFFEICWRRSSITPFLGGSEALDPVDELHWRYVSEWYLLIYLSRCLDQKTANKWPFRSLSQAATYFYQSNHSKAGGILPKDTTSEHTGFCSTLSL